MQTRSRVIIVEEEPSLRRGLSAELRRRGFDVVEAHNAEYARSLVLEDAAALVCDYHVRLESGEGLLRWLRRERPECAGILWTSPADIHVAVDAYEAGLVSRFVLQSWEFGVVGGAIAMQLEQSNQRQKTGVNDTAVPARAGDRDGVGTVLLVEDEDKVREALTRMLGHYGIRVLAVADGAEALHRASVDQFDVALVDLVVPKVIGLDVIRFIKASFPSVIVVAASGLTNREARDEAFAAGADDFVAKPYDSKELVKRLDGHLEMSRIRAAARDSGQRAERAELYAREMSSLLAHDLRNGFAAVELNLGVLEAQEDLPVHAVKAIQAVKRTLHRMASLADNLTQLHLLERQELVPQRASFDLAALLRQVSELHRPAVRSDGVDVRIDCEEELMVNADRGLVERLLHNLVNNAARYVSENGTIRLAARLLSDAERTLMIEVGNTGEAVPENVTSQVFAPGVMADHQSRTGLGLYFCRLVCSAHAGSIAVEPHGDLLANFVIRLPTAERAVQTSAA